MSDMRKRTLPDVRPGQVWADNDPRSAGRTLRIVEVQGIGDSARARAEILTNTSHAQRLVDAKSPYARDMRGKSTRIAVLRFKPNRTGYRLIADSPNGTLG
jgi:hypothetical protein